MQIRAATLFLTFILAIGGFFASPAAAQTYDATYYVSSSGNDANDGLSAATPFLTLAKTANVINSSGTWKNYLVVVMSDLISTAGARYFDNSVTITSQGAARYTVSRGSVFSALSDTARSWYNPPMLEIETTDLSGSPDTPRISLTLGNIIFDDENRHEGTNFAYVPASNPPPSNGLTYVQDGIVATYASNATITLNDGAELRNFGGMSAIRAAYGATVILNDGSLITDTMIAARGPKTGTTYGMNGDAAVSVYNSHFYMNAGAAITNIVDTHGINFSGTAKFYMNGLISGMKGGMNSGDNANGRGIKNAILFNSSATLDLATGLPGSAIIGPDAQIINNQIKSGAVTVNRAPSTTVEIYGKINNNTALAGITTVIGITIAAGTNGGGLYLIGGGTVYLQDGSELNNNAVVSSAYGGAASVQQGTATLIMNGGTVSGNTATGSQTSTSAGIVVNKNRARFIMNGGTINNGPNAVMLMTETAAGYQTDGTLTLNAGTVSGVTVQNTNVYGASSFSTYPGYRYVYISPDVIIGTGYASIAGRQVRPLSADFNIGNPNQTTNYPPIRAALPQGWTMPTTAGNVIAFWVQKTGTAVFSVPAPTTGTAPANYDRTLNIYFAAVQGTLADGNVDPASPVAFLPTTRDGSGNIVVSVPLGIYPAGATVALVQPTKAYGAIEFSAPPVLDYHLGNSDYVIPYTGTYAMPDGLHSLLTQSGYEPTNMVLTIRPDAGVTCNSGLTMTSNFFVAGTPSWNGATSELSVPLTLKPGWDTATDLTSTLAFSCTMGAANYLDGGVLHLSGDVVLTSGGAPYRIYSNVTSTEMSIPTVTIQFDGNGGTVQPGDEERQVKMGQTLGAAMPNDPTRDKYNFIGWNTQADGHGTAITGATVVAGALTLYAKWEPAASTESTDTAAIPALNPAMLILLALALGVLAIRRGVKRRM